MSFGYSVILARAERDRKNPARHPHKQARENIMTALKDIFDAERSDIQKNYDAQKENENRFFEARVRPVLKRITDEINKDPELLATYKHAGDNDSFIAQSKQDTRQFNWAAYITVQDRKSRVEGRATIQMNSGFPEEVSIVTPSRNGYSSRTYRLSVETLKMNEDRYVSTPDRPYAEFVEQGYKSLAEDIVRKAAEDSMAGYANRVRNAPYIPRIPGK